MYPPYRSVRKSLSVSFCMQFSSVCLFLCVELLQIGLRQLVQRNFSDFGNDVIVNTIFIVGSCGNTECVSAVGLIPEVDPIPERHIRLDFIGRASALFFQRFELSGTFCFCFRRYAFCNRQAFLIVPDNNSSFPPTVFTQA